MPRPTPRPRTPDPAPPPAEPPEPGSAEQQVALAIEDDIIFGRLLPGEALREEKLVERFGASRHVVRSALERLIRQGIVEKPRNCSAVVRTFSPRDVRELHEIREILQRQAALSIRLPAAAEDVADIEAIEAEYEAALAAGDLKGMHLANERFHDAVFALGGNRQLQELIRNLLKFTYAVRSRSLADPEDRAAARAEHRLIIAGLRGVDKWALAELTVEHIRRRRDAYLQFLAGRDADRRGRRRAS